MTGSPDVAAAGNERGRATRRRILAAADRCFTEFGLDLTLDQVAKAAGTTRMTVHRHTGGRERLVTHLVLRASVRLADRLRSILDGPASPTVRFTEAMVATVVEIRGTPALSRLFSIADPAGPWEALDPEEQVLGAVRDFFRPYLRDAAEKGELRPGLDTDVALGWLLSQVLLVLVVPSVAADEPRVREAFATFAIPAVFSRPEPVL